MAVIVLVTTIVMDVSYLAFKTTGTESEMHLEFCNIKSNGKIFSEGEIMKKDTKLCFFFI